VNGDTNQHPRQDVELKNLTGWKDTVVLLTSRLDRLGGFQKTELKELTEDCCIDLFYYYFGNTKPTREIVAKIVGLANMHTFTIELLAKGAEREDLEKYYERLIEKGFGDVSRIMDTEHHLKETTIEKHLKILFDMQNRSVEDKKVLNSFAVLPEYCSCSMEEIQNWFGFENADLDQVIRDGWLTYNEDDQQNDDQQNDDQQNDDQQNDDQRYYIHSLVRTIIRFDFLEDEQGKRTIAPEGTNDMILEYFYKHREHGLFDINMGFVSLQRMIGIVESVIGTVDEKESVRFARLYHRIGWSYNDLGDYNKALEYYGKALEIKKSKLGKDDTDTAATYNNIGEVYYAKGDYDKALEYFKKALKINESKLGKDHPDTATTYNNIALVYDNMGEYDKALEYYEKDRKISESKLGKDHPDTATTYNNIAGVYYAKGDYDKALKYYEKALEIVKSKLGKDHPYVASTYNNMAGVYRAKGDYDEALEYYEKALEIRESKLGKDHPLTAATYNNIAWVYQAKGDYDKALEYFLKALRIWLNRDVNHPNANIIFGNLIDCYQEANMEKDFVEWLKERLDEKEWKALLELIRLLKP
jgi:tetratricopeptide (TPR) repeat protein